MHGDFGSDERALPRKPGGLDDVLPFAAEHAEKFGEVFGQHVAFDPEFFEPIDQLHGRRFADLAIGMADDDNFFAAFDRAGKGKRAHGAGHRAGDDVAGIAKPDELLGRHPEDLREQGVKADVDATERYERKFVREIGGMQASGRIACQRAVIGIDYGFEEAHTIGQACGCNIVRAAARRAACRSATSTTSKQICFIKP
jgi:hypothetical protein